MADQISNLALHRPTRDSYGFTLRPQHAQRYRQYASIYKEEEEERSEKWKNFLEQVVKHTQAVSSKSEQKETLPEEANEPKEEENSEIRGDGNDASSKIPINDCSSESDTENEVQISTETESGDVKKWSEIRPSLTTIERIMSTRVKKTKDVKIRPTVTGEAHLEPIIEKTDSVDDELNEIENDSTSNDEDSTSEECAEVTERDELMGDRKSDIDDTTKEKQPVTGVNDLETEKYEDDKHIDDIEPFYAWKEELESLVQGGVPKDLRGEVWQALVGVKARRVERYYHDLLAQENTENVSAAESKWKRQIEKDIPRTFPGHPALDENGRNSLRRVLLAYARHNPSVGYCQAMNFFAGLFLLLMPEENAFWALVGLLDDIFEGYYTEDMIESQVDQLVLEDLMRERFPRLVNHLDYLGVQVAWISGPWFLSIFMNMLPWETVLRVWDVLLYDGNRVILFRTAMALMDLYGPALVTTKDAGDATALLQSLAGSTFDSSQLVLTACMGYLGVTEDRLEELRDKHRPAVLQLVEERAEKGQAWKDSKGLATKLYSFKHEPGSPIAEKKSGEVVGDKSPLKLCSSNIYNILDRLAVNPVIDSIPDLHDQVVWLKVELCRLIEEKRASILRAEELETALMEIVKKDNRDQLRARVEQLEQEVAFLHQSLSDKKEQEAAMLKVLMRVEQEQLVTEEARLKAEQQVAYQKYAVYVLEEKYEKAMASIAEMEKRVVVAESVLEATLQYQAGQVKAHAFPGSSQDNTRKKGLLSFGLGWHK